MPRALFKSFIFIYVSRFMLCLGLDNCTHTILLLPESINIRTAQLRSLYMQLLTPRVTTALETSIEASWYCDQLHTLVPLAFR